jgi:hypothetical protein
MYTLLYQCPLLLAYLLSTPVELMPNATLQARAIAGATQERTLLPVAFRVKAPVTRRPPHRPGRAQ